MFAVFDNLNVYLLTTSKYAVVILRMKIFINRTAETLNTRISSVYP